MDIRKVTPMFSVAPQIEASELEAIQQMGFKSIVCNRPDGEGADQPVFDEIRVEAERLGMSCDYLPVTSGKITDENAEQFGELMESLAHPTLAYCRTGTRCITLWALSNAGNYKPEEILTRAKDAGYDLNGVIKRILNGGKTPSDQVDFSHEVVIIGAGAAGIAVASSLQSRAPNLDIAIVDPASVHYYQPGWTLVGAGVFKPDQTVKTVSSLIPKGVNWIKSAVAAFLPEENKLLLDGCRTVQYEHLVVCPGIKLDWDKIEGLTETLGKNGVTSNYRFDLAPYTWELVQKMRKGKVIFTQPPMPIKCAGAPQKAMYLSCDYWNKEGVLSDIEVDFCNTGAVLFGVKDYVPALMEYVEKYGTKLNFGHQLVSINGNEKTAVFKVMDGDKETFVTKEFDMIHVVPPQSPPDFVRASPLVDEAGWIDVDQSTLRHKKYPNIYSAGDAMNAPNAKTAAAARMQAPVVAQNLLHDRGLMKDRAIYNGYGSCPLTVERGKIILAEFGYGGKLLPSLPTWLIDGTRPSRLAWYMKEKILPPIYFLAMLKGREWMAKPDKEIVEETPK
ncbi:TIGR01244 family sulfur transferase [Enterovibrio paralichthyis]|uniref:TIGR01244 family sulfur transferase n=1 Tax=Enterovibrio paralichthyis TaxID=2853805 RepID=UPI001C442D66|nr:bifunctional protein tyrosine phosphatase family protein/NAD(P)/FAD-dependent oxidoreductase [Enterovibrio paralichthyis]MBV7296708.1 TIGR01244 family phosphatase [Enterovibrio paralichthyis]